MEEKTETINSTVANDSGDLLTAEEEYALAVRIKNGDKAAREKLICSNQRLVGMVAGRYVSVCKELEFDDLKQAGNIGLIRAADLFDCEKGYRFSTYAVWWIRQAITREIADKGRSVRLPVHISEKMTKFRRVAAGIEQATGRPATPEDVAKALGEPLEKITELWDFVVSDPTVSIDKPLGETGESTLGDLLADEHTPLPADATEVKELRVQIERALAHLSPRENMVMRVRFGLDDGIPKTLEDVGEMFGVTRERVRQIESKALRRLRSPRISKILRVFAE